MNTKNPGRTISTTLSATLTIAVLWAGLAAAPSPAADTPNGAAPLSAAETLEDAFWACDYIATIHGIDKTPMDACGAATDRLKNERFGGDFGAMLEWWRQMKPAEHARMAEVADNVVASRAR